MTDYDDSSVRVAVRVRPQLARERIDMCQVCTSITPGEPQVLIGNDNKAFTFDFVFDMPANQDAVYDACCKQLVEGCFEGYNATIFAYGQTGSGKTYTMGTGFDTTIQTEEVGIIPRAVQHLFNSVEERRKIAFENGDALPDFRITAQFLELYNEEIIDLLDTTRDPSDKFKKSHIKIHEDAQGGIYIANITSRPVASYQDTMKCLEIGALSRSTASTNMNAQSSRSHAVFTLLVKQQRVVHEKLMLEDGKDRDTSEPDTVSEFETLTAKFHFVDLAGSERLKRTGATGDRAKEGISINCGLLALGNVISALGDKLKRGSHVPYRDSKLTRLLQDSLGGNSRTVMIACISPSDRDFMETLNTLKYANRARNIKNKVVANQDKTSRQIASLKAQVQELQEELLAYRSGRPPPDGMSISYEANSDMATENSMLLAENNNLRQRVKALRETVDSQAARLAQFVADRDMLIIANSTGDDSQNAVRVMIEGYGKQIEDLRAKLYEAEMSADMAYRQSARISAARSPMVNSSLPSAVSDTSLTPDFHLHDIIVEAKRDLRRQKKIQKVQTSRSRTASIGDMDAEPQDDTSRSESVRLSTNLDDFNLNESSNFTEEVGEEDGSNSDTEENENLREHLAELTCDINIKEKLIEELELSQRRLQTMKVQYEEKMTALNTKIRETETERDRVLASLTNMSGQQESLSEEKTRKIRDDYERKLSEMRSEMQKLQAARKEHQQLLKNQSHHEKQITTLQRELGDMKKEKVKLVQMVQENSQKTRQTEARHSQEIARLKKEQRAKDNQIKALEADKKSKEMVLKRKQEEVALLRKQQKPLSTAAAGRVGKYDKAPTVPVLPFTTSLQRRDMRPKPTVFSPKMSKARWELVEKSLNSVIVKKQTLSNMERDMDRWIRQRESWRKKIEKTRRKLEKSSENRDEQARRQLQEELEVQRANMKLVQDNIGDCQSTIVGLEEAKDDELDPLNLARQCRSLDEALYMFEHFIQLVVNKGTELAQKDADVKELEAKLHHERMDGTFQREMLQYLIQDKVDIDIDRSLLSPGMDDDEEEEDEDSDGGVSAINSRSPSPIDNRMLLDSQALQSTCVVPPASEMANRAVQGSMESVASKTGGKARRRTALPEDLLYGSGPPGAPASSSSPATALPTIGSSPITAEQMAEVTAESRNVIQQLEKLVEDTKMLDTNSVLAKKADNTTALPGSTNLSSSPSITLVPPPKNVPLAKPKLTVRVPESTPEVTKLLTPEVSPMLSNKNIAKDSTSSSGSWRRGNSVTSVSSSTSSLSHQGSTSDMSPPSSPPVKYRSENVFSRLTSVSGQPTSPHPTRGVINPVTARTYRTGPLVHAHTAVGHAKAVLSVFATNDLMFTSSKDRTAKVWDLTTGEEFVTLDDHPNNVTAIRYSEDTGLVYTVSAYFVKVWDIRQGRKCVKTLLSSGLLNEGSMAVSVNSRKVVCPPGETNINDIQLNSSGSVLYTAAGSSVRIWDIRTFKAMGKLSGSHQSPVMVMAVDDTDTADGNTCIVTGSKDHYIKVFEVMEDSVGVLSPKHSLLPPHYDGIQSLCLMGDLLFSGSRDMCIKKWDLSECTLKQSINNAHKDWVCGLALLPGGNCLLSGCRGGMVKLWHIDSCTALGEMKAHESPINAVTTNASLVFTASDDRTVRLWQERSGVDSADGGGTSPSSAAAARLE